MFLRDVLLRDWPTQAAYPFNLPALQGISTISFDRPVTFLVGENGSGKSTLLEAIAITAGFNPEGGSKGNLFSNAQTESPLHEHLRLSWFPKATHGFFFRAESFFNFASHIDDVEREYGTGYAAYGGRSLHEQSHGESFLALFMYRLHSRSKALYLLDEPEAALSPARQLALLRLLWEHAQAGTAQFIIATHSPILLGYPDAAILSFDHSPLAKITYEETESYRLTRQFLMHREAIFQELFGPGD
ncbi:MAG: AAA family ATPase [Thermaerobacter sp.]|nr:AAA family ATPase [Thermaerobacter sp.]